MGDGQEEASWFEASSEVEVLDGHGKPIGQLRPGKRYRALTVGPFEVTVEGPGGTVGHVDRAAIDIVNGESSSDEQAEGTSEPASKTDLSPPTDPTTVTRNPTEPPPVFAPAGWLPDPDNPEVYLRYWDGDVWTEHRSPMPAGGLASEVPTAGSASTAERRPAAHQGLARIVGLLSAVWAAVGVLRVAAFANEWGDGYGQFDPESPWWLFTSTWSVWFGRLSLGSLFFPDGGIKLSPVWMFTAVVGLVGVIVAIAPTRRKRRLLIGLLSVHVLATWFFGVDSDFLGDVVRVLLYASVLPVIFIIALIASNRPASEPGAS